MLLKRIVKRYDSRVHSFNDPNSFLFPGSSLLWSSVIMMLFKYQSCGLENFVAEPEKNDQKIPLVESSEEKCLIKGEPILV